MRVMQDHAYQMHTADLGQHLIDTWSGCEANEAILSTCCNIKAQVQTVRKWINWIFLVCAAVMCNCGYQSYYMQVTCLHKVV